MILIVGLGNPGAKYKSTYHNVGFMVVDEFAKKLKIKVSTEECAARTAKGNYKGVDFVVAKPETFMNLSGESVRQMIRKYDVCEQLELIVVYDDADLPLGKLRLREEGSAGTHNGMRNIVKELNTTNFKRLRIGIKNAELAEKQVEIVEYVLSKPCFEDKQILDASIAIASEALIEFLSGAEIQRIEEKINRRK